eukprot:1150451-Pelagomonas_calceolata.AAC.2
MSRVHQQSVGAECKSKVHEQSADADEHEHNAWTWRMNTVHKQSQQAGASLPVNACCNSKVAALTEQALLYIWCLLCIGAHRAAGHALATLPCIGNPAAHRLPCHAQAVCTGPPALPCAQAALPCTYHQAALPCTSCTAMYLLYCHALPDCHALPVLPCNYRPCLWTGCPAMHFLHCHALIPLACGQAVPHIPDACIGCSALAFAQAALPSTAGQSQPGYLRAEEPEDNIVRTRTYDLYITYDQESGVRDRTSDLHATHDQVCYSGGGPRCSVFSMLDVSSIGLALPCIGLGSELVLHLIKLVGTVH